MNTAVSATDVARGATPITLFSARISAAPLDVDDLDRLATAAYLTGRDLEFQRILERLYRVHVEADDRARAARCAFWLAMTFLLRGESGRSNAWTARGQRLVEDHDCVERGYLAVAVAEQQLREGQPDAAHATAGQAFDIGESFRDADLTAAARHAQGRALIQRGDVVAGLKRLDETMLAVVAGELSPIMTGRMYCSVIDTCRQVYALERAREWTSAFSTRVRATAGHDRVHRHLPGASCRDHATAGGVAGGAGRSPPCVRACPARRPQATGRRALSTGRDSSAARRVRESGGRLSRRK